MTHPGNKLYELRKERKLKLREVAEFTGVSVSSLSKIENRKNSPTYAVLARICTGLGVTVEELTGEHLAVGARTINRRARDYGDKWAQEKVELSYELDSKRLCPAILHVGRDFGAVASGGETFLYVLSGTIAMRMASYSETILTVGDSVHFEADAEHSIGSVGDVIATVLMVSL